MNVPRVLIANADDLGMSEAINRGILHAFQAGIVRSASLMVNMPAVEHGVELARKNPDLEIGLHLNITAGHCCSDPARIPSLVTPDGTFRFDEARIDDSVSWLHKLVETDPQTIDEIVTEFRAQIERFKQTGVELRHLNTHHYSSLFHPGILSALLKVTLEESLPCRGISLPLIELLDHSPTVAEGMRRAIVESGSVTPDHSLSNLWDASGEPGDAQTYERAIIDRLSSCNGNSVELVVHPTDLDSPPESYAWARRLETRLVTSDSFRETIGQLNFKPAGYAAIVGIPAATETNPCCTP